MFITYAKYNSDGYGKYKSRLYSSLSTHTALLRFKWNLHQAYIKNRTESVL